MRLFNRPFRLTMFACFTFVILVMSTRSAPAQAQQPALHILHAQPLTLKLKPDEAANSPADRYIVSTSVLVRNESEGQHTLTFSVMIPDEADEFACTDEAGKDACVVVDLNPGQSQDKSIDPFTAKEFDLQFSMNNPPNTLTGYLVVEAEEGRVVPGSMLLTLNKPVVSRVLARFLLSQLSRPENLADRLIICSFVAAAIIVFLAVLFARSNIQFTKSFQTVTTFSFSDSWASTLTTIGGVLGTVLATGVLSQSTQTLSKQNYAGLCILFSLLILIAGVIINHIKKVAVFLLTAGITLWAAFGQLLITMLLLGEIDLQATLSRGIFWSLQVILIIAFACVGIYGLVTIRSRVGGSAATANGAPPAAQPRAALL